jgi:hypothetical protein
MIIFSGNLMSMKNALCIPSLKCIKPSAPSPDTEETFVQLHPMLDRWFCHQSDSFIPRVH